MIGFTPYFPGGSSGSGGDPSGGVEEGPWAVATGGTVSEYTDADGQDWRVHECLDSGSVELTSGGLIERLYIAGGGAGAGSADINMGAGGGGGGGLLILPATYFDAGIYPILVGAGGAGRQRVTTGYSGSPTEAFGLVVEGGGGGGGAGRRGLFGSCGGGGGGGVSSSYPRGVGGESLAYSGDFGILTSEQLAAFFELSVKIGTAGGAGSEIMNTNTGAGGGGAGGPGGNGGSGNAGIGGVGRATNFFGATTILGGGGSGAEAERGGGTVAPYSEGGGGGAFKLDGDLGTGGGGGGRGFKSSSGLGVGGSGGSGRFAIRYKI